MAWGASWLCPFHCSFIRDGIEIFKKRYHAEKNFGHFSWEKGTILQAFDFGNDVCEVWEVCIQFCTFSRMFKHIALTHEIRFQCCKTFFLQAWKPDWNRRIFGQLGEKIFVTVINLRFLCNFPQHAFDCHTAWIFFIASDFWNGCFYTSLAEISFNTLHQALSRGFCLLLAKHSSQSNLCLSPICLLFFQFWRCHRKSFLWWCCPDIPHRLHHLGSHSKKNYGIIWDFFPNGGPPPPLLGTPYSKKIYRLFCILGP